MRKNRWKIKHRSAQRVTLFRRNNSIITFFLSSSSLSRARFTTSHSVCHSGREPFGKKPNISFPFARSLQRNSSYLRPCLTNIIIPSFFFSNPSRPKTFLFAPIIIISTLPTRAFCLLGNLRAISNQHEIHIHGSTFRTNHFFHTSRSVTSLDKITKSFFAMKSSALFRFTKSLDLLRLFCKSSCLWRLKCLSDRPVGIKKRDYVNFLHGPVQTRLWRSRSWRAFVISRKKICTPFFCQTWTDFERFFTLFEK